MFTSCHFLSKLTRYSTNRSVVLPKALSITKFRAKSSFCLPYSRGRLISPALGVHIVPKKKTQKSASRRANIVSSARSGASLSEEMGRSSPCFFFFSQYFSFARHSSFNSYFKWNSSLSSCSCFHHACGWNFIFVL